MIKNKVLFAGCSFTADSGFTSENQIKFHWPHLLGKHYDFDIDNIAIGGMSNEEICFRTIERVTQNPHYDLAIVMWSGLNRKWVYFSDNNVDDFTIINNGIIVGNMRYHKSVQDYAKLHYGYFNNRYINVKRFLLMIKTLSTMLDAVRIPYIFINGFEYQFDRLSRIYENDLHTALNDDEKKMIDFSNRPDEYIIAKLRDLRIIMDSIDRSKFLNHGNYSFYKATVDLADDGEHPGPKSNQDLTDELIKHIDDNIMLSRENI